MIQAKIFMQLLLLSLVCFAQISNDEYRLSRPVKHLTLSISKIEDLSCFLKVTFKSTSF